MSKKLRSPLPWHRKQLQQPLHRALLLQFVAERESGVDIVVIAAPFANSVQRTFSLEFHHDAMRGALGDTHLSGDFAQGGVRVVRDAENDVGVIREERPMRHDHRLAILDNNVKQ